MRFAILGAAGQLGSDICERLGDEAIPATRADVDLAKPTGIAAWLDSVRPDIVINCAAYNFVDRAESEPDAAFAVNAWGVRALADACQHRGLFLVHISTDYVFGLDDQRTTPYTEADAPGPVSIYALSKLAGEHLVRALCRRHLVIRTCGLFGKHCGAKGNFVQTMLRLGAQGKTLRVVDDQICTPTSTADLAAATVALCRSGTSGLIHYTNAGSATWCQFARAIFELSDMRVDLQAITSEQFGAAARRPKYSVLALDRYRSLGLPEPRPWREALADYLTSGER